MQPHVNLLITRRECNHLRAFLSMCQLSNSLDDSEKKVLEEIYKQLTENYQKEFGESDG